jgi:alkylation response protein AidB-like acyl-CoA dehydrogenase
MDFTFTEDQIAFRDSISRFLMTEAAPELLRDIWETPTGRSPELWAKIAEQGLMGLSAPKPMAAWAWPMWTGHCCCRKWAITLCPIP